jgi:hypothetical protein
VADIVPLPSRSPAPATSSRSSTARSSTARVSVSRDSAARDTAAQISAAQGSARRSSAQRGSAPGSSAQRDATAAQTAVALVRSIGLTGLVRPATANAKPARAHSGITHLWPASSAAGTVASGTVASGTNAGNIAGGLGAPDRVLPVIRELRPLLPGGGLRRGSTIATSGATSLVIGLLAAASQAGSWCAVVGMPTLGAVAAAEAGVALDRLALVPHPGPDWANVVAALLDGVDVVVTAPPGPIAASLTNRLAARARQRGSVLIGCGRWPGADVSIDSMCGDWEGLNDGRGRLRRRRLTVTARGRGAASQPREATFWMPAYASLGDGWSIDQWRERTNTDRLGEHDQTERTLTLLPTPLDVAVSTDPPIANRSIAELDREFADEFDEFATREAVS